MLALPLHASNPTLAPRVHTTEIIHSIALTSCAGKGFLAHRCPSRTEIKIKHRLRREGGVVRGRIAWKMNGAFVVPPHLDHPNFSVRGPAGALDLRLKSLTMHRRATCGQRGRAGGTAPSKDSSKLPAAVECFVERCATLGVANAIRTQACANELLKSCAAPSQAIA